MKKRISIPRLALAPIGLLAMFILLSTSRLLAGGAMLVVHIDTPILLQTAPVANWQENYNLIDHGNHFRRPINDYSANVITFQPDLHLENNVKASEEGGNPKPACSVHHTNAPHACENALYSTEWNPSLFNDMSRATNRNDQPQQLRNLIYLPVPRQRLNASLDNLQAVSIPESDPKYDIEINVQIVTEPQQQITLGEQEIIYDTFIDHFGNEIQFSMVGPALYIVDDQEFEQPRETIFLDEEDNIEQPALIAMEGTNIATEGQAADQEEREKQSSNPVAPSVSLQAWPNPSTGQFQARLNDLQGTKVELQVMSLDGKILSTASSMGEAIHFDLSIYAAGTYFVKATTAQGSACSKPVIIQH